MKIELAIYVVGERIAVRLGKHRIAGPYWLFRGTPKATFLVEMSDIMNSLAQMAAKEPKPDENV